MRFFRSLQSDTVSDEELKKAAMDQEALNAINAKKIEALSKSEEKVACLKDDLINVLIETCIFHSLYTSICSI